MPELESRPEPEGPQPATRLVSAGSVPPWLLGFRSDVTWKKKVATVCYAFLALSIVVNLIAGHVGSVLGSLIVLGLLIGIPASRRGEVSLRGDRGLRAFRYENGALFPHSTFRCSEDRLREPWPRLLRQTNTRGEHLLFVPLFANQPAEYATEAVLRGVDPFYVFEGLRRVQIIKTVAEGAGPSGPFHASSPLLRMLLPFWLRGSLRPTTMATGTPNVFRCAVVPCQDVITSAAAPLAREVESAFRRHVKHFPDAIAKAALLDNVSDPAEICDRVSQALFSEQGAAVVTLLSTDDVAWRLRWLLDRLQPENSTQTAGAGIPDIANAAEFTVEDPETLPTLADIGGMAELKKTIRETIGLMIEHPEEVEQMSVNFNGVLLYGPPGTGKTAIARATAGEYQMSFLVVTGGDIAGKWMGESERRLKAVFRTAELHAPCLLFFDEFDSLAGRRDHGGGDEHLKRVVGTLLASLEAIRRKHGVVVMAATNDLEGLDEAVVRPGRFDQRIRVDLPDDLARLAILNSRLRDVPTTGVLDLAELVKDTEGRSAADLVSLVDAAKLLALRRAVGEGVAQAAVSTDDLVGALEARRGKDAPTLAPLTWDDLILPVETKAQLRSLAELIADPRAGRDVGMRRPSGALLYGPPGTGKTTVARVIASETKGRVSFLPVKGSDLVSKWVGDSAKQVSDLFARARQSAPTIIFIDEIEVLLPKRGGQEASAERESLINEFLQQLDGIDSTPGVFVLGATNLPDKLDPAVVRGGRLGRRVEIPLPTVVERAALFALHTRGIKLHVDVDVDALARLTERFSGAGIEDLCQEAVEHAYERTDGPRAVTQEDVLAVLRRKRPVQRTERRGWDELILPSETKAELLSLAALIADPESGAEFGLKRPTGALLYGPPGTGKTTVAKVLASQLEGDVSFVSVKGSDLVSKWIGDSAKNVGELFDKARAATPAIIFIDELETLLPRRGSGGSHEADAVVTEFLQELDGIDSTPGVFVLGATNLPDNVDPAVLRGGRISRQIQIPLPTLENRVDLFKLHTRDMKLSEVEFERLAERTQGMSGADIESVCQQAGEHAFRRPNGPRAVTGEDFTVAFQRARSDGSQA